MLSPTQLHELTTRGHVNVGPVVDAVGAEAMQASVWDFLESRGVNQDSPDGWPEEIVKLQPLRKQRVFDSFLGPTLDAICDQLMRPGEWTDLGTDPQALLSLPGQGPWKLPSKMWHFDLPARGPTTTWGAVRLLGFVDDVETQGGGTLVVEGSHTLVQRLVDASPEGNAGASADVRRSLSHFDFFAALNEPSSAQRDRALQRGDSVEGIQVRVAELKGRAGELVVMHPWVMHNISMNCSSRPRMMMSYTRYSSGQDWF